MLQNIPYKQWAEVCHNNILAMLQAFDFSYGLPTEHPINIVYIVVNSQYQRKCINEQTNYLNTKTLQSHHIYLNCSLYLTFISWLMLIYLLTYVVSYNTNNHRKSVQWKLDDNDLNDNQNHMQMFHKQKIAYH